jgi:aryl-alcohol dehydrogenase-like predicted oxidoreductase
MNGVDAIDTAPADGDAQAYIGEALKGWRGIRPMISSKAGRLRGSSAYEGHYDYTDEGMFRSVEASLETMGIPALDILFLHEPWMVAPEETGRVIETLIRIKSRGYARSLGIGGACPAWIYPYMASGIFDVVMEFNRLNACNLSALKDTLPYCEKHRLRYFAASPLYMGLLGRNFEPFTKEKPDWLSDELVSIACVLESLARENKMSLPSLAHRFLLSLPYEFSIVIGASNGEEFYDSMKALEKGPLPAELSEKILENISFIRT